MVTVTHARAGVGLREPDSEYEERGAAADRVEQLLTTGHGDGEQAEVEHEEEPEEQRGVRAETGHSGQVDREDQRHDRGRDTRPLEQHAGLHARALSPLETAASQVSATNDVTENTKEDTHRQRELV